jgi:hypothetical protein
MDLQTIKEITRTALNNTRTTLPNYPDEIPEELQQLLSYNLPITHRYETKATVIALHKIYKFDTLPEDYFKMKEPPPKDPKDLDPAIKNLVPITDRKELQNLGDYKKKLLEFYDFNRISEAYFKLPDPKPNLPTTYHKLDRRIRHFFPFNPQDPSTTMGKMIKMLREYYIFRVIPNDYIKYKPKLPTDTTKIKTKTKYEYPITDGQKAKEFISEIIPTYRFSIPLDPQIMTANPTEKPRLPEDLKKITEYNITIPIRTPKQLVDTARLLRETYFFHKLPSTWINIPNETNIVETQKLPNNQAKPDLPQSCEEILQALKENKSKLQKSY